MRFFVLSVSILNVNTMVLTVAITKKNMDEKYDWMHKWVTYIKKPKKLNRKNNCVWFLRKVVT